MTIRHLFPFGTAMLLAAALLPGQGDPAHEIQELARAVEQQLQEIDRLLLESGKKNRARQEPKELLQQARERSEAVEGGIDELIDKLNEMKNQSGGSGQPDDQQQPQDEQQQSDARQQQRNQGQRNRRENDTPDLVPRPQSGQQPQGQQPQPQPGEGQQQPQPANGDPQGGQENPDGGENTRGNQPPQGETGPGAPGTGDGAWGELQPYMNFLKNRGSRPPAVPEKFRKYWEAYLKQKQGQGGGSGR